MYEYNDTFYQHINEGAKQSAEVVLKIINEQLKVKSVLDLGCGQGAWLNVWKQLGAEEVLGVDGYYVNTDSLLIEKSEFKAHDLCEPLHLDRQFDLVQSLEVAEHLPGEVADQFVGSLTAHGKLILFSAATVGQGGEEHINEQPYGYWRDKFFQRGYCLVDMIRPAIKGNKRVKPWYRYNIFVFVERGLLDLLPEGISLCRISEGSPVPDLSPFWYKVRKGVLRLLPPKMLTWLAALKKKLAIRFRMFWPGLS